MSAGADPSPAVALRGVTVELGGRRALDAVDLVVARGERVAVIGPSGAGKTTLLRVLGAVLHPDAGSVSVLGGDPAAGSARDRRRLRARIGTVHQRFDLVGELRVVHNVLAGLLGRWSLGRAAWSLLSPREAPAAREALAAVGLADRIDARTASLSGGEQQRVAVARVLVQDPELALADEPVASLDPVRAREVVDLLVGPVAARGTTLVASLHDVGLALACFERVVGLRDGRVVLDAAPADVDDATVQRLYRGDPEGVPGAPATGLATDTAS